jgi:bilirubin oxidase
MKDDDFAGTNRVMQFVVGKTVTDNSNNGGPPASLTNLDLPPAKLSLDHSFRFERT